MGYTSYTSFTVVVTGYTHNGDHWADGSILLFFKRTWDDCHIGLFMCFMDGVTPARHKIAPRKGR